MTTWIDTRWDGQHGIGRYAREIYPRLTVESSPLPVRGATASGLNAIKRVPKGLIYSPGYAAFARAERQVMTIHDLIHLQTPWPQRAKYLAFYNAVARPVIRRAGVVFTVSETSRRAIAAWLKDPSVEIINAGLGSSDAFRTDVEAAPADDPYVMYVGNLRAHKNLRTVLRALKHLPGAHLRALIPAGEHDEAHAICDRLRITDRVQLLAGLSDDDLARQYRGASATVMPSVVEGFGLPPLESIMTGTPVIFWEGCSAVAETVGDDGWAIEDSQDAVEWADRIEDAVNAHRRVMPQTRTYDWDATAATIDGVLKRLS
ncbi:glycosyltransferase family 4 protein [Microbacterium amylolyticum]|uniref:Glycosyltransferase involved in cell wall biosynthesis n=1 Tax=Microbacterium amylolyticum TaxID=936337 RepID=A0ABS4ZIC6_9MICO|nr:glycosyltransferase family 1 protein [Microbacterium amylolyticum]MBP2437036.1 glycosyltransferase involved in cell wall biosynthesis [Microbacterium amylolyticum]